MPITIPPYVQYQTALFPLPGLWNKRPPEGDKYVSCEIDWGVTTGTTRAVQFELSGNSPVAFSQIAALAVDNSRGSADVVFLFPDSGFSLVIPDHSGGIYPVVTNALTFYAISTGSQVGDVLVFQILNSIPPPIQTPSVQTPQLFTAVSSGQIPLVAPISQQVIPVGISGTLRSLSIVFEFNVAALTNAVCELIDGNSTILWQAQVCSPGQGGSLVISLENQSLRFVNGLQFRVVSTSVTSGQVNVNLYYTTP